MSTWEVIVFACHAGDIWFPVEKWNPGPFPCSPAFWVFAFCRIIAISGIYSVKFVCIIMCGISAVLFAVHFSFVYRNFNTAKGQESYGNNHLHWNRFECVMLCGVQEYDHSVYFRGCSRRLRENGKQRDLNIAYRAPHSAFTYQWLWLLLPQSNRRWHSYCKNGFLSKVLIKI